MHGNMSGHCGCVGVVDICVSYCGYCKYCLFLILTLHVGNCVEVIFFVNL